MKAVLDELPISISAYITDTQHLSLEQHGAYLLILMALRRGGGWIADDDAKIARVCKVTVARWRRIAPDLRALLISETGRLSQKRVLKDVKIALEISEKNRASGKAGGIAKSLKTKDPTLATATVSLGDRQTGKKDDLLPLLTTQDSKSERKKENKSRRGEPLPSGWVPSASLIEYGIAMGFTASQIDGCAEDMRLWAAANSNRPIGRKADWEATFKGWLRREWSRRGLNKAPHGGASGGRREDDRTGDLGFGAINAQLRARRAERGEKV